MNLQNLPRILNPARLRRSSFFFLLLLAIGGGATALPADNFDITIRAEVDKTQPFVGEQVILTYAILTQQPVYGIEIEEQPDLNHFLTGAISLPERPQVQAVNVGGRIYQAFPIKRAALYPLVAKELTIPPLTVTVDVALPASDSSAVSTTIYRRSNPVTIWPKPLPAAGRPQDFSGAVGDYQIYMEIDKDRVKTGEPVELTLKIRGRGNISALSLPPLATTEQFRVYTAKLVTSRFGLSVTLGDGKTGVGYSGEKVWSIAIVPKVAGDITLKPIQVSCFNPETRNYYAARSQSLVLHVEKSMAANETRQHEADVANRSQEHGKGYSARGWVFSLFIILMIMVFYYLGIFARIISPRKRLSSEDTKQHVESYLAEAKAVLPNPKSMAFFDLIADGIKGCVERKLQISLASLTTAEIKVRITERGVAAADAEEVARLLEACDSARFNAGSPSLSMKEKIYEDTVGLMKRIK